MSQERSSNSSPVPTGDSGELGLERHVSAEVRLQETSPHIQLQSKEILAMTAGEEEAVEEGTPVMPVGDCGEPLPASSVMTEAVEAGVNRPPPGVSKRELSSQAQKSSKRVTPTRKAGSTLNGTTTERGKAGVNRPTPDISKRELSSRAQMSSEGVTSTSGSGLERQTSALTVPGAVAVSGNSSRNDVENPASPSTSDDDFDYVTSPPPLTVTATAISIQELEDEMRDRILGQPVQAVPEPVTPIESNDRKTDNRHRKLLYVLACACVTIVVVVAVAVGVIVGTRDDNGNRKPPPPKANGGGANNSGGMTRPVQTALQKELLSTLSQISPDKGLALETPKSPQFRAFQWLADTDFSDFSAAELSSRYAMAVLYYSTNGPNWSNRDLWLSNSSICDWDGDTPLTHCVGGSFRRQLILNNNNLKGSLPPELALLGENLQELDLSFNSLTGTIPSEIGRLTGLTRLVLQSNSLTGSAIPLEMSALTRLMVFDVKLNRELAGSLPPEMGAWTDLHDLNVESTNMNGALPSAIGKWTNLERWYSRRVKWDGPIPSEVGLMSSLKELDMAGAGGSMYGPIPEEIYNITSLTWLALTRTGVQGTISTAIGQLTSLDRLHLGINRLEGTIPSQIEKLTLLQELRLNSQVSL
jgi:hypothetical protein